MMRRPPRSTRVRSSAASDVYKRQTQSDDHAEENAERARDETDGVIPRPEQDVLTRHQVLVHVSHWGLRRPSGARSVLDLNRFLASTVGDGDHDPDPQRDHDPDG